MASGIIRTREFIKRARELSGYNRRAWLTPWLLLLLVGALLLIEWMYAPFEIALGDYMSWTNSIRPEVGQGWELSQESEDAKRKLGEIAEESEAKKAAALTLKDWSQVPELLTKYSAISISPDRFLQLYQLLPSVLQERMFSRIEMMRLRTGGRWQRVFFILENEQLRVYLVDAHNMVLANNELTPQFFQRWQSFREPVRGKLEDFDLFLGRIFPAELFFQVLQPSGLFQLKGVDAEWIAGLSGYLTRIGIAASADADGLHAIGFELEGGEGAVVYLLWIEDQQATALFREMMDRSFRGAMP